MSLCCDSGQSCRIAHSTVANGCADTTQKSGVLSLYLDAKGDELTDTYHDSLEEALAQANWEFNVDPDEWQTAEL